MTMPAKAPVRVLVVGGGPAGLMAAECLSGAGVAVDLYDAMPTVGRKFLLAGRGGLNLTHSEALQPFLSRYGKRCGAMTPLLENFGAAQIQGWAASLGIATFVGSSGRIFPSDMKAAPLLRAWLHRLRHPATGPSVHFHMRHRWQGWAEAAEGRMTALRFETPTGLVEAQGDAVVLALGGASWARLGSDGAWVSTLSSHDIEVAPLRPSNCGFDLLSGWSSHFQQRFAGQPFKSVALTVTDADGQQRRRKGEFVATGSGLEGSLIYAFSSILRDQIEIAGRTTVVLDLLPDIAHERVQAEVSHPRGSRSLSSHLKSRLGIDGIKAAVLYECLGPARMQDPGLLANAIKSLPIVLSATRPVDEAISTAGGVRFEALDDRLMVKHLPGLFCAGEMLDWEAPTGGYLLTACMASGRHAAQGVLAYLQEKIAEKPCQ
ncbi:MAG: TIGR03862 family flavoprotein [Betaproteobacteria bacterium]